MELRFCSRNSSKNKWRSTLIDKHYKNQHDCRWGSNHRYGHSLYDCPCCVGKFRWRKAKNKNIRYDVSTQQQNGCEDREIFFNSEASIIDIDDINDDIAYIPNWQCTQCTFINLHSTPFCSVCSKPFDYNHRNNLHYDYKQPIIIQYKSKKKNKRKKSIKSTLNNIAKNITKTDQNYIVGAEKHRLSLYKNNKTKQKHIHRQIIQATTSAATQLCDIEISIIATKYNQYEYTENKLFYDLKQESFWINVPMKLINIKLQRCSLRLIPKNKQNAKCIHFEPMITTFFVPVYMTKYSFIFRHDSVPKILENRHLFRVVAHCLAQCSIKNIKNIKFNHNLSTTSFNLDQVLLEFIPAVDILQNVLFPLIGYSESLFIKSNARNVNMSKMIFKKQKNDEMNPIIPIDDRYKSSLHHVTYKQILSKAATKQKPVQLEHDESESESESSRLVLSLFDDSDSDSEKTETNVNVSEVNILFKQPYKYCGRSNIHLADAVERNRRWWGNVKYIQGKRKRKYKLNDRVSVKMWGNHWVKATIIAMVFGEVKVKYDHYSAYPEEWIKKCDYKSKLRLCDVSTPIGNKSQHRDVYSRKRKAYSKTISYFKPNSR